MSAINAESLPSSNRATYWAEIISQTATLPYVHIDIEERKCRIAEPASASVNEGPIARRLRELREQQPMQTTGMCLGGSYLKLFFQNETGSARLRVTAHDVLAKACEHTVESKDEDETFLNGVCIFRRLNSKQSPKHISTILGAGALSWLDTNTVEIDGNDSIKDVVAQGLDRTNVLRLDFKRPNSNTVLTLQKTGPLESLELMRDTLMIALPATRL